MFVIPALMVAYWLILWNELFRHRYHWWSCNDGYLYLLDEQTGYIWKEMQHQAAVGNILQEELNNDGTTHLFQKTVWFDHHSFKC